MTALNVTEINRPHGITDVEWKVLQAAITTVRSGTCKTRPTRYGVVLTVEWSFFGSMSYELPDYEIESDDFSEWLRALLEGYIATSAIKHWLR